MHQRKRITHLESILNMAKVGRLAMKPPSTSRILRFSNGNMYFFSFSYSKNPECDLILTETFFSHTSESVNQDRLSVDRTKK